MADVTIGTLIERVHGLFADADLSFGHGTDNAWDEAVALVLGYLQKPDELSSLKLVVSATKVGDIVELAELRVHSRKPLAYLLGRCKFMGYDFLVPQGVMIPRSPIGYLLHDGLGPWYPNTVARILDLCSGTGCLGIIAAHLFPEAQVTLVENDPLALQVCGQNVAAHGLSDRVIVSPTDVLSPWLLGGEFDLIIANPPYVDAADMSSLPVEYQYEPAQGLSGSDDGLIFMRHILSQLPQYLSAQGLFVGEVGASAGVLARQFEDLELIWPDLTEGGEGVFLLEAAALSSHTLRRDEYEDK